MDRPAVKRNPAPADLSIAIQAGGRSQRMGRDKGMVLLQGTPLIEHVLSRVSSLADDLLITTNQPQIYSHLGLPVFPDRQPGAGALEGLRTALENSKGEHVLVVACDMPFLNQALLKHLLERRGRADVVVPHWNNRYQTMHAVYDRQACLAALLQAMRRDQRRMIAFYPWVRVLTVPEPDIARLDPQGLSFFNINTPEQLEEAEGILAAGREQ